VVVVDQTHSACFPFPVVNQLHECLIFVPILACEPDCHPADLLDRFDCQLPWWLLYSKPRQEKQLMRHLRALGISHYGPLIPHRQRSPAGRIRVSYVPLFANYVFLCGDDEARYHAISTGSVHKVIPVTEREQFCDDLIQIRNLISIGVPLTREGRLQAGQRVRVRSGVFAGYEGTIIRREQETRLLVSVRFMEQCVSVKLDDCQVECVG
jgi:transcriptional antiterminator RfaH